MAFWTSERLKQEQEQHAIIVPFHQEQIKVNSYELSPGPEFYDTSMKRGRETFGDGRPIVIPRGQFGLLITNEVITLPPHVMAFISIKFSVKARGLINVSGFHVDPGFNGRLKFSVLNAGPQDVLIDPGDPTFCIWFSDLVGPLPPGPPRINEPNPYNGDHKDQTRITAADVRVIQGDVASPAQLRHEMDKLRRQLRFIQSVGATVLAVIVLPLVVAVAAAKWSQTESRGDVPGGIIRFQDSQLDKSVTVRPATGGSGSKSSIGTAGP